MERVHIVAKGPRPQIEDAERESRPVGRTRGSTAWSGKIHISHEECENPIEPHQLGEHRANPEVPEDHQEIRRHSTADEELETKIKEMEEHDNHMKVQMEQLEDEHNIEKVMFVTKML